MFLEAVEHFSFLFRWNRTAEAWTDVPHRAGDEEPWPSMESVTSTWHSQLPSSPHISSTVHGARATDVGYVYGQPWRPPPPGSGKMAFPWVGKQGTWLCILPGACCHCAQTHYLKEHGPISSKLTGVYMPHGEVKEFGFELSALTQISWKVPFIWRLRNLLASPTACQGTWVSPSNRPSDNTGTWGQNSKWRVCVCKRMCTRVRVWNFTSEFYCAKISYLYVLVSQSGAEKELHWYLVTPGECTRALEALWPMECPLSLKVSE